MAAAAVYQVHPVVNTQSHVTYARLYASEHQQVRFTFSTQTITVIIQELLPSGLVDLWMEVFFFVDGWFSDSLNKANMGIFKI